MNAPSAAPAPSTVEELVEVVRSTPRLLAVGAGTKPRLWSVDPDVALVSLRALSGVVEYQPSEFVITVRAGTPLREVAEVLHRQGQYLPFDPPFVEAGATVGGTVAAGLNGPGRLRYGGLRDFILGVRFVDGRGRLLRLGGKVVKNAAGFDVPKFFVGALGRFGVLAEVTLKVFPRAAAQRTLRLHAAGPAALANILANAGRARWELDALEASPADGAVWARLAGPEPALEPIAREILGRWPGEVLDPETARALWRDWNEFGWAHPGGALVKLVLTPSRLNAFETMTRSLRGARMRIGAAGSVGHLSLPAESDHAHLAEVEAGLRALGWPALTLRGALPLQPGAVDGSAIAAAVKAAFDPEGRFPGF